MEQEKQGALTARKVTQGSRTAPMMAEGEDRIMASYRDKYKRLAQIKRRYDPANAFHVNQNIKPAG